VREGRVQAGGATRRHGGGEPIGRGLASLLAPLERDEFSLSIATLPGFGSAGSLPPHLQRMADVGSAWLVASTPIIA
jgi:hypothetical protein